jgi:ATP-dependent DNA helicase RecQ
MKEKALIILQNALGDPQASFRSGQWESIERVLKSRSMLVVQRTGWGKSIVYFLATKLMREQGSGPTLLVSPLLSLMRNQLEAAEKIGIVARTINSSNTDEWDQIQHELIENSVDLLLISPERLANKTFRDNVLSVVAERIGFFVIDEAHCISDWGHDFRPDYRRIVRVLQALPPNIPVLATTATANDRVVKDVMSQLGENIELIRGPLVRESLKLQNINLPSQAERMAWLALTIPKIDGSGIVYTLTQRDSERLAKWLQQNGINAQAYHSGISKNEDGVPIKEQLEQQLLNNQIKVLVATVALGMGFDKPDLGFVIHFQRPSSVVHYYQQVGRAGRAVDEAFGILLCGEEDDRISDFFIRSAFPPQQHVESIIQVLDSSDEGLSVLEIQKQLNIRKSHIDKTIKYLTVESPSPLTKVGSKWHVTASAANYSIDQDYVDSITQIRKQEQAQMREYMDYKGCLMEFLERALDDPAPQKCGKCINCNSALLLEDKIDDELVNQATKFLRTNYIRIEPRKQWPLKGMFDNYDFEAKNITEEFRYSEGKALSLWRDAGWGKLVYIGKYKTGKFDDRLVNACVEMILEWSPSPKPMWVTCIPSLKHPNLVPDFAERLASSLGLPYIPCISKIKDNSEQKLMDNSFQQAKNLDGVFSIDSNIRDTPCLLVDDMIDSRWTLTVAAALLRSAGCEAVFPLALALNSPRMD